MTMNYLNSERSKMPKREAMFTLADLQRVEIRENARYAWESGYNVTVLAPEITEIDRVSAEYWLINHGVIYTELRIGG